MSLSDWNSVEAATERLHEYVRWHYRAVPVEDLAPADVPGIWERKTVCPGGCMPLAHKTPMHHTISYYDPGRDRATGRWASPFRTWRILREASRA